MKKYLINNIFTRVFSYYLIVKTIFLYENIRNDNGKYKKKVTYFFCVYILSQKFTYKIIIIALQL